MSYFTTLLIVIILFYGIYRRNHKLIFSLCILSLFADNFRTNIGPSLLLVNSIGFLVTPFLIRKSVLLDRKVGKLLKSFYIEFVYLIFLGIIFGFVFPWADYTGDRLWTQTAPGRTVISLVRYVNEFIILYYFYWLFKEKKLDFKAFVQIIAVVSILSFWVGFADYFIGYRIKSIFFYVEDNLKDRFLGMNGEPKLLGRQGAVAYGIILYYILKYKSNWLLNFALFTNVLAVILSYSATGLVIFFAVNIIIIYSLGKIKYIPLLTIFLMIFFALLLQIDFIQQVTFPKIAGAVFGVERTNWSMPIVEGEPAFFSRFDVFDRLGLIFLYKNPWYILSGVGPNLISLPASDYIPTWITFYEAGRIDSVPNFMPINIIARSGLFGLCLFSLGVSRVLRFIRERSNRDADVIFWIGIVFSLIYFSVLFYAFAGIAIGLSSAKNSPKRIEM